MLGLMRFKIPLMILATLLIQSTGSFANSVIPIEIILQWEGREVEAPNLEAISNFRDVEPDIPLVHLFSPDYFLTQDGRKANLDKILSLLHDKDEVGLYLTAQKRVLQVARVIPRSMPTFWSRLSEVSYCQSDCGLDVPLHVLPREDLMKVFTIGEASLRKAGFTRLRTYATRGGFHIPLLEEIARGFGFRAGLFQVDPILFKERFDQYPLAQWKIDQHMLGKALGDQVQSKSVNRDLSNVGAFIDLQEKSQILKMFIAFTEGSRELKAKGFQIYLNQETAYLGTPRLKAVVSEIRELAKTKDLEIEFRTHSGEKNGRPLDSEQRITESF